MTREDRAFLVAPLITPFAFVFGIAFTDMEMDFTSYISAFLVITIVGLPIVYTIEFFIGYRFYRLFLKKKKANIFTVTGGGVILANLPTIFIATFGQFGKQMHDLTMIFPLFSFVGFMIGLAFWFLVNSNQPPKNTG